MTRPLPHCAACGETLRHRGRMLLLWRKAPGQPTIGWCEGCQWGTEDPEFQKLRPSGPDAPSDDSKVPEVLAAIEARGPKRVVRSARRRPSA